jgi:hypothetical protein
MRELKLLRHGLDAEYHRARNVAARSGGAGDEANLHRIVGGGEDNGNRRGCRLCRQISRGIATVGYANVFNGLIPRRIPPRPAPFSSMRSMG